MLPVLPHIMRHLRDFSDILMMRELSRGFKESLRTLKIDVEDRNHVIVLDRLLEILSGVKNLHVQKLKISDENASYPNLHHLYAKGMIFRGSLSHLFPNLKSLVVWRFPGPTEIFPQVKRAQLRANVLDKSAVARMGEMFPEIRSLRLDNIDNLTLHREEMDSLVLIHDSWIPAQKVSVKIKRCRLFCLKEISGKRLSGSIEVGGVDTLFLICTWDMTNISLPQVRHLVLGQEFAPVLENMFETVYLLYDLYYPLILQAENIITKHPILSVKGNQILKRIVFSTHRKDFQSIDIVSDRPTLLIIDALIHGKCVIKLEGIHTVIFAKKASRKTLEKLKDIPYKNVPEEDEDLRWWRTHKPFNRNSISI